MRIVMRNDIKKLLKDDHFWTYFPEYDDIHQKLIAKKYKVGCCGLSEELYDTLLGCILKNPAKWKSFLGIDKIQIFYGHPHRTAKVL